MKYSAFQKCVFHHGLHSKKNLLVSATAGSGKSFTIRKLAGFLKRKFPKAKIVSVQFNTHIRDAMTEAFTKAGLDIEAHTVSSLGYKYLRTEGPRPARKLRVFKGKYFIIIRTLIMTAFFRQAQDLKDIRAAKGGYITQHLNENALRLGSANPSYHKKSFYYGILREIQAITMMCCQTLTEPTRDGIKRMVMEYNMNIRDFDFDVMWQIVERAILIGAQQVESGDALDFIDQVYFPLKEIEEFDNSYDYVLVDEGQDLNRMQIEFLLKVLKDGGKMIVVGDANQSIMGWAGALNGALIEFGKMINAEALPLSICYRCPKSSIELAKRLVPSIQHPDDAIDGEVRYLHNESVLIAEAQPGDGVISRLTAPLVSLCIRMIAGGKKAMVKGKSIGIGLVDLIRDIDSTKGANSFLGNLMLERHKALERMSDEENPFTEMKKQDVADQYDCIESLYEHHCQKGTKSVYHLINIINEMFSDEIHSNYIVLATCHRCKGNEYDRVWLLTNKMPFSYEGQPPSAFLQEANLLFVALTRSKKQLNIMFIDTEDVKYPDDPKLLESNWIDVIERTAEKSGIRNQNDAIPFVEYSIPDGWSPKKDKALKKAKKITVTKTKPKKPSKKSSFMSNEDDDYYDGEMNDDAFHLKEKKDPYKEARKNRASKLKKEIRESSQLDFSQLLNSLKKKKSK